MPGPSSSSLGTSARSKTLQTRKSMRTGPPRGSRGSSNDSFLDKRFSLRDVARQSSIALSVGKQALALVNAEKKYLFAAGNDAPGTTPILTGVSLMATGDTASTRDGLSVRFKGIDLRGSVAINSSNAAYDFVRIIFFRQVISNGVSFAAANLLTTSVPKSSYNYKTRRTYTVLWDETFAVNPTLKNQTFSTFIPLDNVSTWTDVSADVADTDSGVYWLLVIGADNTNKATCDWTTQMYFYDN